MPFMPYGKNTMMPAGQIVGPPPQGKRALTVEDLVVECRKHRVTDAPEPLTLETVQSLLHVTVAFILESVDYEARISSVPAQIVRVFGTMLATLEEQAEMTH
jgi:hypothetical protein